MRLPRLRFTVRVLMSAIAILALALGADLMRRRWTHTRRMARHYAGAERLYRDQAREIAAEIKRGRKELGVALERRLWMADRAAQFRSDWEQAASRPWESEPPDPRRLSTPAPPADDAGR